MRVILISRITLSDPMAIMSEAEVQKAVMRGLIAISDNYWGSFLEYKPDNLVSE